ncbi:hypothetical protein HII31_04798 [Pseudocercospora fuligena]|uniref:Uncharacterized protein n=1 Tax=Pseudocercospora fuligena TaxID=685502 RepID=A0A8H6RMM6_9PEZI|nr:hypothetical protein HII31_04798 [Pseudocercospora fuligena]
MRSKALLLLAALAVLFSIIGAYPNSTPSILINGNSAVTETSISIRPTGDVVPFVPKVKVNIRLTTLSIILWAFTANCAAPLGVSVDISLAWRCGASMIFATAATLSAFFRSFDKRDNAAMAEFNANHIYHFPALDGGDAPLKQLGNAYTPGSPPIKALECKYPRTEGCFDVYYSNGLHEDGVSVVHALETRATSSSTKAKRQEDEGVTGTETNGHEVYGKYFFVNVDKNEEIAMGFDGGFPTNLLDSVADDTNFNTPGASCLNLLDDANGKAATYGYFTSSETEDDIVKQHEGYATWLLACQQLLK